ncbi:hypothetical protein ZOD2009_17478 [Haladaptatus paucihalophilus DX253]|uniref:Uncharacterized protein n=2 Tax=Haladaptatus paucihalophilus DX253 TaxID=797209 RepID=E7QXF7_HALPU|nr:hypothetical protein [Haladaptatus paucihalophilus]EFW90960.1 hypothetical protein ZOD2009_17478 [Haladaptatus paucihalophilus DX253]
MSQNRRPMYIGTEPESATCDRHGEMEQQAPVVTFDGHVHALTKPVSVRNCPECCLEIARESGGPTGSEQDAFEACWRQLVDAEWRNGLQRLFVDLGRGAVEEETIYLHEKLDDDEIPDYLRESADWTIQTAGSSNAE